MDVAMPGMNGLEATKLIKARPDAPAVVILTLYDTIEHRCLAAAAGADGFIPKADFGAYVYDLLDAVSGAHRPLAELIRGAEKTGAGSLPGGVSGNGGGNKCPQ
jgi:DNA-binding NarL/FixJ family response regulator